MENKKCGVCNKFLPKTSDFFFKRIIKQKLANGEIVYYNSFRSCCKDCHAKKTNERRIKKRCKEMGCDSEDYRKNWKKQYSESRTIDLEVKSKLTDAQYSNYIKFIRKGLVKTYDEYLIYVEKSKKERNKRLIREVLLRKKYFTTKDKKQAQRMYAKNERERLTDSYIANLVMNKRISELTPEIIETKRIIIKIKRELKK